MQRLRKRPRIDNLGAQQRAGSARWGRTIYLGLLAALGASLGYYLVGDMFVLSADGTVLKERHAIDAGYAAKITDVYVKQGESVQKGDPLLKLESFSMVKEIADMTLREGELALREGQLRSRLTQIRFLTPLAERSAKENSSTVARFDQVSSKGIVPATTRNGAVRDSLAASERLVELQSQGESTQAELELLARSRATSTAAMAQLHSIYDDGNVRATADGVIGARVPVAGKVVQFGENLTDINGGTSYVLAYLPDSYLFATKEGMAVTVTNGADSVTGRIESILGVADALPDEFQNMFRPRDRSRLMRIALDDETPFAISQKVWVTGCALGFCWAG